MWTLLTIILVEGFVTVSVEILAIRQMMPFVGNNVIVTSIIIGIFLLFLAIGYFRGGSYTERYSSRLFNNFFKSAFLIGIGMSPSFIYSFFSSLGTVDQLLQLVFYLLLVTAPIVYILGQTLPITTNLFRAERIGAISGKALFLSTIGSFLGSILTTLLLFNYLGIAATVFTNVCLLTFLILLLMDKQTFSYRRIILLSFLLVVSYVLNITMEKNEFIRTNNYGDYRVTPHFQFSPNNFVKALFINNSFSSFLNDKNQGAPYIELIKKLIFHDLNLRDKKILVLGAGGFTLTAEGDHHNQFTYVDIDPDIYKLIKNNFNEHILGNFVAMDARIYIKNIKNYYDVIISDVYSNQITIPSHLLTVEHYRDIDNALTSDGLALFNVIINPELTDAFSKRIDNTITSVFSSCMKIPVIYWNKKSNVIYVCRKVAKNDNVIYTDNLNRATLDYFGE